MAVKEKKVEVGHKLIRLNKYLSEAGFCSRREADHIIEQGRIMVDGECAVPGMKILPSQRIIVDGKQIIKEEEKKDSSVVNSRFSSIPHF